MTYVRPRFVSERERAELWVDGKRQDDRRWEDCGPCSVLMAVLAATKNAKPATLDEAERLRWQAGYGPLGGTDIARLGAVVPARYGIRQPRHVTGAGAIWTALTPGRCAAVAGSMGGFPDGHRLRRHLPSFEGFHAVWVGRYTDDERVLWMDPLAPAGYGGEWVTRAELRAYLSRGLASAVLTSIGKEA